MRAPPFLKSIKAFTLVELSIVIVIIGLIVAGVTAGASIVRSAKIRGVITDANMYIIAVNTFYLQYNAYPGDITNATSYWPAVVLVNGNGDKFIGSCGATGVCSDSIEDLPAFQELGLTKLIPGQYTGSGAAATGVNLPVSSYSAKSTFWFYAGNLWNNYAMGNSLALGNASVSGTDDPQVLAADAYAIDKKNRRWQTAFRKSGWLASFWRVYIRYGGSKYAKQTNFCIFNRWQHQVYNAFCDEPLYI